MPDATSTSSTSTSTGSGAGGGSVAVESSASTHSVSDALVVNADGTVSVSGSLSPSTATELETQFYGLHQDLSALTYSVNFLTVVIVATLICFIFWSVLKFSMGRGDFFGAYYCCCVLDCYG